MGFYFEDHQSMFAREGRQVEKTLEGIVRRYLGQNPPHPPTFRAYSKRGILRGKDYRYHADFTKMFPDARPEQWIYAWARYWADAPAELKFDITCFGPMVVYCNGAMIFRSNIFSERHSNERHSVFIPLQAGWNHIIIRFKKTRAGFGGIFGTWLGKLPYYFLMPTEERRGQEGWIFTEPMSKELSPLPAAGMRESDTGIQWHPEQQWDCAELQKAPLHRMYGLVPGTFAVGWTRAFFFKPGTAEYSLKGWNRGPVEAYVDDEQVYHSGRSGNIDSVIRVPFGNHDVMVRCDCRESDWGFDISLADGNQAVDFVSPCNITGSSQPWIYIGPFTRDTKLDLKELRNLYRIFPAATGKTYWRLDMPDTWVRPYNENALFGRWNYPLGVTLYGLLHSSRAIGSAEAEEYVVRHVQFCCDMFPYALWDKEQYGGATTVHHLLSSIDSLDDCGSFGSCLLEVARHFEIRGFREIADYVADYISNRQIRLPDGTFFRKNLMHVFHENTMWADDLYMSVPFLCRYYQLTGDSKYLDDAAHQFLGFRKHLFIPEWRVMSHVYDFDRQLATGVPWGRGNGWVIFSLSELLEVLPEDHEQRAAILSMFRELCEGYLALQDEEGMWHQVLNHQDSYPETSCTSMFTYAFARGIRHNWFQEPNSYIRSVFRAWDALNRASIDQGGNVHGVCRGSEFSFTPEYYKKELLWNLNDTHGIGIVLLAGNEVLRLLKHLKAVKTGDAPRFSTQE
jgi:unsaturated rhamnogalacturonyl hydrolase